MKYVIISIGLVLETAIMLGIVTGSTTLAIYINGTILSGAIGMTIGIILAVAFCLFIADKLS